MGNPWGSFPGLVLKVVVMTLLSVLPDQRHSPWTRSSIYDNQTILRLLFDHERVSKGAGCICIERFTKSSKLCSPRTNIIEMPWSIRTVLVRY